MKEMQDEIVIASQDYWFKVVEMLQTNSALVDPSESGGTVVWFIGDTAGVFDHMPFASDKEAFQALRRNGFHRFVEDSKAQDSLRPPEPPFVRREHPNGPIYSSGRLWL